MATAKKTIAYLYPYSTGSNSAAALASALGIRRIRREGSNFAGKAHHAVINWGCRRLPEAVTSSGRVLNAPERVETASNKLSFFQAMAAVEETQRPRMPRFTTSPTEAAGWIENGDDRCNVIFARTELNGHSGEGIVRYDASNIAELRALRAGVLLVEYVRKRTEFRLHFAKRLDGNPVNQFLTQRKATQTGAAEGTVNYEIRSHANGFIFARNDGVEVPADVRAQALRAFEASGLDFCAVDVIWNERRQEAYILEVNTAPGMEGSTLTDYVEALSQLY
jgi:hypothetical protein